MSMKIARQRGFTLVEVMVASLIGLILIGGVIQIFISSKLAYLRHENLSQMQENGRFALQFMHRYLGRTGLGSPTTPLTLVDSTTNAQDQITGQFVTSGSGKFCQGNNYSNETVISTFFIANEPNSNKPGLRCSRSEGTTGSQELVPNIEHLRLQYGVWDPSTSGTVYSEAVTKGFYDGNTVNTRDVATDDLDRVYAIRVALIARSQEEVRLKNEEKAYTLLDQVLLKDDRYLRQVYTTTILLPNRIQQ